MKKFRRFLPALLVPILALVAWYIGTNGLEDTGLSTYIGPDGKVEYVIGLANAGFADVTLLDAWIDDGRRPDQLQLGVTFDSFHGVQAGLDHPAIQFMPLDAMPIRRQLSHEAVSEAIRNGDGKVPTFYGLRFAWQGEIERVTIRYRVLGVVRTLEVSRWFGESEAAR